MISALWKWFKSLFIKKEMGILTERLIKNATNALMREIFNIENQRKAYEFVKELSKNTEMSNAEKAAVFNKKMAEWALKCGKVLVESVINCLREMAVNVVKDEILALEGKTDR